MTPEEVEAQVTRNNKLYAMSHGIAFPQTPGLALKNRRWFNASRQTICPFCGEPWKYCLCRYCDDCGEMIAPLITAEGQECPTRGRKLGEINEDPEYDTSAQDNDVRVINGQR